MDEKINQEMHKHLEKLLNKATNIEEIGFAMGFAEYYENLGYNVSKFRDKLSEKINIICYFNYN